MTTVNERGDPIPGQELSDLSESSSSFIEQLLLLVSYNLQLKKNVFFWIVINKAADQWDFILQVGNTSGSN